MSPSPIKTPRLIRDAHHRYFLDGVELIGNTAALKSMGYINDRFYTVGGTARGTDVHEATRLLDQRKLNWATVGRVAHELAEYRRFKVTERFTPLTIEKPVANLTYGYATTPDRFGLLGRGKAHRAVVQIKAGNPEPWVGLQLALEALCWPGSSPIRRYALELPARGPYRLHEYTDPLDFQLALGAVAGANWKRRQGYVVTTG